MKILILTFILLALVFVLITLHALHLSYENYIEMLDKQRKEASDDV